MTIERLDETHTEPRRRTRGWPPIHDPETREWMALSDDEFLVAVKARAATFERLPFSEEAYRFGLTYPWERPAGSYMLGDGETRTIADVDLEAFTADRHPLLAFGANAAPHRLIERFAGFPEPADREVLVLTGHLHGFDVGANVVPVGYGAVPAVLLHAPGTAVRAAVLWLTTRQVETLVFAELGYRLGRLDHAQIDVDDADVTIDTVFAFVGRMGALRLDGDPVALAAVPARNRTARAMSQEELLRELGVLAFGPGTTALEMSRRCFDDADAVISTLLPLTVPTALQLPGGCWTPYPSGG